MSTVNVVTNTPLDPVVPVNSVEPTVAKGDDCVFVTESFFNRLSVDGGATFQAFAWSIPYQVFPGATTKDFFGDQSVIWAPQTQRFIWAMLHTPTGAPRRQIRIAYTSSAVMKGSQGKIWTWLDIDPQQLGLTDSFDYPQLSLGENFLYITAHHAPGVKVTGVAIMRIALKDLVAMDSHSVGIQYWVSNSTSNFGVAQRCGSRAYWGSHENTSNLFRLYFWDESSNSIQHGDVSIPTWDNTNFQSLTPDEFDWMQNAWARITGTRVGSSDLVFGWTAGRDKDRPHPYIYLIQIRQDLKTQALTLTGLRHIWNRDHAWAFAGLGSVPQAGERAPLALSCAWGGGNRYFPTHVVGFVDMPLSGGSNYTNVGVSGCTVGAARWGDFVTVGIDDMLDGVFTTAGYEVDKSSKFTSGTQSVTHFVKFTSL